MKPSNVSSYDYTKLTEMAMDFTDRGVAANARLEDLLGFVREAWVYTHQDKLARAKSEAHASWNRAQRPL